MRLLRNRLGIELLSNYERINEIDVERFGEQTGDIDVTLRRVIKIIDVLDGDFNIGIPNEYVDRIETTGNRVGQVNNYLPVVAAAQNCLECADEYQNAKESGSESEIQAAEEDLLIATLLLVCEVCLFQSSTTYRLSFNGTRYVANRGLFRLQKNVGNRTYAFILSEVHWAIRGSISAAPKYIEERSQKIATELDSEITISEQFELRSIDGDNLIDGLEETIDSSQAWAEETYEDVSDRTSNINFDINWRSDDDDDKDDGIFGLP